MLLAGLVGVGFALRFVCLFISVIVYDFRYYFAIGLVAWLGTWVVLGMGFGVFLGFSVWGVDFGFSSFSRLFVGG